MATRGGRLTDCGKPVISDGGGLVAAGGWPCITVGGAPAVVFTYGMGRTSPGACCTTGGRPTATFPWLTGIVSGAPDALVVGIVPCTGIVDIGPRSVGGGGMPTTSPHYLPSAEHTRCRPQTLTLQPPTTKKKKVLKRGRAQSQRGATTDAKAILRNSCLG